MIFPAVLKWSDAECLRQNLQLNADNKRAVLGGVLGQIRFPLMTVEEFAQGIIIMINFKKHFLSIYIFLKLFC